MVYSPYKNKAISNKTLNFMLDADALCVGIDNLPLEKDANRFAGMVLELFADISIWAAVKKAVPTA